MKPTDQHIKKEYVYKFEFSFSDSVNPYGKVGLEKEDAFSLWACNQKSDELFIECFGGGPAHYPWCEARGSDYEEVRAFVRAVRRRLKGKKTIYFEEA